MADGIHSDRKRRFQSVAQVLATQRGQLEQALLHIGGRDWHAQKITHSITRLKIVERELMEVVNGPGTLS